MSEPATETTTRPSGPAARYRTVVMDPPWPIGHFPAWFRKDRRSRREQTLGFNPTPYPTMTLEAIGALPVADLCEDGAHLYLWTTDSFLEDALAMVRRWGFAKSATLCWCKEPMGRGLGGTFPSNVEYVLFCRRADNPGWRDLGAWLKERRLAAGLSAAACCHALGAHGKVNHGGMQSNWEAGQSLPSSEQWAKLKTLLRFGDERDGEIVRVPPPSAARAQGRWFRWPRGRHSAKPEAFQDIVESVSPGPYLELFARRQRPGWHTWGNEVCCHVRL